MEKINIDSNLITCLEASLLMNSWRTCFLSNPHPHLSPSRTIRRRPPLLLLLRSPPVPRWMMSYPKVHPIRKSSLLDPQRCRFRPRLRLLRSSRTNMRTSQLFRCTYCYPEQQPTPMRMMQKHRRCCFGL